MTMNVSINCYVLTDASIPWEASRVNVRLANHWHRMVAPVNVRTYV